MNDKKATEVNKKSDIKETEEIAIESKDSNNIDDLEKQAAENWE